MFDRAKNLGKYAQERYHIPQGLLEDFRRDEFVVDPKTREVRPRRWI